MYSAKQYNKLIKSKSIKIARQLQIHIQLNVISKSLNIKVNVKLLDSTFDDDDDDDDDDVFAVWLTKKKRFALFPAIVRDPHHRKFPTCREQDLNLHRT